MLQSEGGLLSVVADATEAHESIIEVVNLAEAQAQTFDTTVIIDKSRCQTQGYLVGVVNAVTAGKASVAKALKGTTFRTSQTPAGSD